MSNQKVSAGLIDQSGDFNFTGELKLKGSPIVSSVGSIKSLSVPTVTGQSFSVTGFYAGTTVGGGDFIYDASKDKADHNGGTVIAPEAIASWDGSQADIATLLNWTGTGIGCFVRLLQGGLQVEYFGAVVGDTLDTTQSILAAIKAAVKSSGLAAAGDPTGAVTFGQSGVYRITQSGVFSSYDAIKRNGILFSGQGKQNTVIWLDSDSESWFYDNGATLRSWGSTFRSMSFHGGATWRHLGIGYSNFKSNIKGFRFTGPGWESDHLFDDVGFVWIDIILSADGTNNADTMKFTACTAIKCKLATYLNNPQSLSITWSQCYLTNHFGDIFQFGAVNGAGNIAFTDCTAVMTTDDWGAGSGAILRATLGGTTASNAPIKISGSRFELKGQGTSICEMSAAGTMLSFSDCSFLNTATSLKTIAKVGGNCTLKLDGCSYAPQGGGAVDWEVVSTTRQSKNASVKIVDSNMSKWNTLHNKVFTGGRGNIELEGCWEELLDATVEPFVRSINGFYRGTDRSSNTGFRQSKKFSVNPLRGGLLPDTTSNEATLLLPDRSVLCSVQLNIKPGAAGSSASDYRLIIGNNSKTIVYAQTPMFIQNSGVSFYLNIGVLLGTEQVDRTVRVWADDGSGGVSGAGYVAPEVFNIEYY